MTKNNKKYPEVSFGVAVQHFRKLLGISQEELGFRADLHRTFISDIERGARNPTIKTLWKIAKALEIMPSKLVKYAENDWLT